MPTDLDLVLVEIAGEVRKQRGGRILPRSLPDSNYADFPPFLDENRCREARQAAEESGMVSHTHIVTEAFANATAEATRLRPRLLKQRLLELAAAVEEWIEDMDRRYPVPARKPSAPRKEKK